MTWLMLGVSIIAFLGFAELPDGILSGLASATLILCVGFWLGRLLSWW